jgi:hypothetical protein
LGALFASLSKPPSEPPGIRYSVAEIDGRPFAKIGKSADERAAILLDAGGPVKQSQQVRLQNLTVLHRVQCEVVSDTGTTIGLYTVIECGDDAELRAYFLVVADAMIRSFGSAADPNEIDEMIAAFVELFRVVTAKPTHSLRGLWGELALIAESRDVPRTFSAWHEDPSDRWDFAESDQRIEVKTAQRGTRRHHFSLEQLVEADMSVVVVSIQVESSAAGQSVADLVTELAPVLASPADVATLLSNVGRALGTSWRDLTARFDRVLARQSIAVYRANEIPKLECPTPPMVSSVEFTSDLALVPTLEAPEIRALGGLVEATF